MSSRLLIRVVAAALAAAALATSCSRPTEPLVVWSNVPEVSFVVERYNFLHDTDARFRFVENLTQALTQERPEADLVIGRWVNPPPVNALMEDRESYAASLDLPSEIDGGPSEALLNSGPQWVPLSFSLPTLVMRPGTDVSDSAVSATLADLGALYRADTPPVHFAPLSNPETMYALHRSLGFVPSVASDGSPAWDSARLGAAMDAVRSWQEEFNGGNAAESVYVERYLYEDRFRQLDKNRVSVVYMPSNELFTRRFFDERRYDFRWLSGTDGTITANEDVVYGGVPDSSTRRAAAVRMLSWLTTTQAQVDFMRAKIEARVDSFGFLDGFSTLTATNRAMERELYPELAGRIPGTAALQFSGALPRYWDEARRDVVEPYLRNNTEPERLTDALELWYRQRGD